MTVKVVIGKYLDRLREMEQIKPLHRRRPIPNAKDIATAADVSLSAYYKWAANRSNNINRKLTYTSIKLLRDCGFLPVINDILEYVPETDSQTSIDLDLQ